MGKRKSTRSATKEETSHLIRQLKALKEGVIKSQEYQEECQRRVEFYRKRQEEYHVKLVAAGVKVDIDMDSGKVVESFVRVDEKKQGGIQGYLSMLQRNAKAQEIPRNGRDAESKCCYCGKNGRFLLDDGQSGAALGFASRDKGRSAQ